MKKQQLFLVGSALILFSVLYFFGKTVPPKKAAPVVESTQSAEKQLISFDTILVRAKEKISPDQSRRLTALENAVLRGDVKDQQIHIYHQLARFWYDSAHLFEPYAWYTAQAAKLENSEKSLTFAARLFLDNLMTEGQPAMQYWLASNAKDLFERALVINPANDSSTIGLGACYLFGNISDNPMKGILPVREIAEKHPDNLYAQFILGLGGKKSGQFDKAIERFQIILAHEPANLEAMFNLAECYELKGDKSNAVKWYKSLKKTVKIPEAEAEIDKRIKELEK